MQNSQLKTFYCPTHPQQKILFICAVNDWHFEPLCQLCTATHTQNHVKRLKINLQSFDQIQKKVLKNQSQVCGKYKKQVQIVNQLIQKSKQQNFQVISNLKVIQQKIIQRTKQFFAQLCQKVKQTFKQAYLQNYLKLMDLSLNLKNQIGSIQKLKNPQLNFQQLKTSIKKIYFQDKLQSYMQQSQEIISDFKQKYNQIQQFDKNKRIAFQDQNKFYTALFNVISTQLKLNNLYTLQNGNKKPGASLTNLKKQTINQKANEKQQMKKPIPKPKKKLCKNCNQQMEYLTQNKKHLICKFCNMKQRNYVKKAF